MVAPEPAQDESAHGAGATSPAYRSHTSLNRIIPSGIGS